MAFQSVPETAEIVISYSGSGSNMVNVLGARKVGGYNLTDIGVLAANVDSVVGVNWLPLQTLDVQYTGTLVRGLEDENDFEALNNTSAGFGADLAVGMAGNVTLSVKKVSGLTGRSARGRLYWIGLPRDALQTNKNRIDQIAVDAIELALAAMLTGIIGAGWLPVIVSRFSAGVKRPVGVTFTWSDSETVNIDADSQRRRLL